MVEHALFRSSLVAVRRKSFLFTNSLSICFRDVDEK